MADIDRYIELLADAGPEPVARTRPDALARGLPTYFTGKSCPARHVAGRYVANWTCVECNKAKIEPWRAANQQKLRDDKRRWFIENEAHAMEVQARWRAANPDKVRALSSRHKAKRRRAEGTHGAKDIAKLRTRQRNRCAHPWCRVSLRDGYNVDHIIPIAKGGTNWPTNLQLLCVPCNKKKKDRHPVDHARLNGFLV